MTEILQLDPGPIGELVGLVLVQMKVFIRSSLDVPSEEVNVFQGL